TCALPIFCHTCHMVYGPGVERQEEKFLQRTNKLHTRTGFGEHTLGLYSAIESTYPVDYVLCNHTRIFSECNQAFSGIGLLQNDCGSRGPFQLQELCNQFHDFRICFRSSNNRHCHDFYKDKMEGLTIME